MTRSSRRPDWGGTPPVSDAEARRIIVDTAIRVAAVDGIKATNIKRVAAEIGTTRQTVYRLFPSTDQLLVAVSLAAGGRLLNELLENASQHARFEDKAVESLLFLSRRIPEDSFIRQFFCMGRGLDARLRESFSSDARHYAAQMLKAIYMQSGKLVRSRQEEAWLVDLAEHMQRVLLSMILAPTERISDPVGARDYLNRWFRPLVENAEDKFTREW